MNRPEPVKLDELSERVTQLLRQQHELVETLTRGQQHFQRLARSVWRVQEEERRRLARELHDGLGQNLTALVRLIDGARDALGNGTDVARQLLQQAHVLGESTLQDTRALSRLLRPQILDDLGLDAALRWLGRTINESHALSIDVQLVEPLPAFDNDLATVIFRVAQEALTNVARHAGARAAEIALERDDGTVVLRVTDDGRGIDRAAILSKARREDAIAGTEGEALTDDALLRVIARPGFSTAQQVSGVSGRGVGVDVAMTRVRALGGTLAIASELGQGTTFTLRVPLTLAIVRALLAQVIGGGYAVPLAYVAETVEFDAGAITAISNREALVVRERAIPTVHLRDLVAAPAPAAPARRPTIILEVGERRSALVVDALLGQQDIVIEPFDAPRGLPAYVGGATILADGAPALILDAAALV